MKSEVAEIHNFLHRLLPHRAYWDMHKVIFYRESNSRVYHDYDSNPHNISAWREWLIVISQELQRELA